MTSGYKINTTWIFSDKRHLTPKGRGITTTAATKGCSSFEVFVKSCSIFTVECPCGIYYSINLLSLKDASPRACWEGFLNILKCFKIFLKHFKKLFFLTTTKQGLSWWLKFNKAPINFCKLENLFAFRTWEKDGSSYETELCKISIK